ncbi:MAG: Fic family protein [Aquihabitans sp.]
MMADPTRKGAGGPAEWPALTYESVPWSPRDDVSVPRSRRAAHAGPYEAAIPPAIAQLDLALTTETLALAGEASAEIARFDAELGADIAPYAPLLLRSESAASSKIENLTASAKAIALAELGDPSKQNASAIVANTRAMQSALVLADDVDEHAILDMHETLLGPSQPDWVGHWRDQQVWIGGSNYGPHGALFTPPRHERVAGAMADLVAFVRRDDMPALVQATIAHAQFETIHPFPDGNGRTGRALIHSLLRAKRLTRTVTVPVSAGLLTDTDAYFASLTAYRDGNPTTIVELLAEASFRAVDNGRALAADLNTIRAGWNDQITVRRGATAHRLADLLVRQPVVDSPLVQRELGVAATNANTAIDHLVDKAVLVKVSGNYRNRKWAASEVLHALDDFSERAGRRSRLS